MKDMNTTKSRVWAIDQMDVWLDTQGFYRKHTARDGTCLFRAVSEQIFLTQAFHSEVRRQTVDYELRHAKYFQKMVTCPFDDYADKMRNPKEWGGKVEIEAMSRIYKHDFEMFQEIGKPAEHVTNSGYLKKILLCYSQDGHFDSVYTKDYIATAALCQSLVYEVLYKNVFGLKEVDYAVRKMLHDKSTKYQKDYIPFLSSSFALRLEMRDNCLNVKDLLHYGITPFPYKVAKSLDTEVYRNVEYDTWNEYRKGLRYGFCAWNCRELQVGVKCLVKIDETKTYHGHIQEMQANKGPVVVFIEEIGKMLTVPYNSLEMIPQSPVSSSPVRALLPFNVPLIQLQAEDGCRNKWLLKSVPLRSKSKEMNDYIGKEETQIKEPRKKIENENKVLSEYYKQETDEQQNSENNIHNQTFPSAQTVVQHEERVVPDSTKPENAIPLYISGDSYRYPTFSTNSTLNLPITEATQASFQPANFPVNFMANKSLNMDGSDLPHEDVSTLRFFYNLGLDHLRMNCGTWNVKPGNSYYISGIIPAQTSYVPVETPAPYETTFIQQTIPVSEGQRKEMVASPGVIAQANEISPAHQILPKFNNKDKQTHNVQTSEISSTTNIGIPLSPAYYPHVDCEQMYCMAVPYADYNYEYPTHRYIPTSFINPDGLVYQTVLPPSVISTTPPTM